jgi:hypothetical protein
MLEVLDVDEAPYGDEKTRWYYSLAEGINPKALDPESLPEMSVGPPSPQEERDRDSGKHSPDGDIPGEGQPAANGHAPAQPASHCDRCGEQLLNRLQKERRICGPCLIREAGLV